MHSLPQSSYHAVEEAPAAAPVVEVGTASAPSALDAALIENAAMKPVLAKHNIRVNMSALRVQDGQVVGEVNYLPPGVRSAAAPANQPLSLDEVAKWSASEVNSRWDEVKSLLQQ